MTRRADRREEGEAAPGRLSGAEVAEQLSFHFTLRGLKEALGQTRIAAARTKRDVLERWEIETLQRHLATLGGRLPPSAARADEQKMAAIGPTPSDLGLSPRALRALG